MNQKANWLLTLGRVIVKSMVFVGLVSTLLLAGGTYVAAQNPSFSGIIDALNNIAAAIRDVAIQGEQGPPGPEGEPGPLAEIYVRSITAPMVTGVFGTPQVLCDSGDVATGGGVSCPVSGGCGQASNGPYVGISGPVIDEGTGMPIGWEFAMGNVTVGSPIERELYVVCADISAM